MTLSLFLIATVAVLQIVGMVCILSCLRRVRATQRYQLELHHEILVKFHQHGLVGSNNLEQDIISPVQMSQFLKYMTPKQNTRYRRWLLGLEHKRFGRDEILELKRLYEIGRK